MVTVDSNGIIVHWRNIARNIGVAVSTAKDYEKRLGLPVKRMGGVVYVKYEELFAWRVAENNRKRKLKAKSAKSG
jgi:hypothetical protein